MVKVLSLSKDFSNSSVETSITTPACLKYFVLPQSLSLWLECKHTFIVENEIMRLVGHFWGISQLLVEIDIGLNYSFAGLDPTSRQLGLLSFSVKELHR